MNCRRRTRRLLPPPLLLLALAACLAVAHAEDGGAAEAAAVEEAAGSHSVDAPPSAPTPSDKQHLQRDGNNAPPADEGGKMYTKPAENRRMGPAPVHAPKRHQIKPDATSRPSVDVPRGDGGGGYRPTATSSHDGQSASPGEGEDHAQDHVEARRPPHLTNEEEQAFEYVYEFGTEAYVSEVQRRYADKPLGEVHAFIERRRQAKEDMVGNILREAEIYKKEHGAVDIGEFVERRKREEREKMKEINVEVGEWIQRGMGPPEVARMLVEKFAQRREEWEEELRQLEAKYGIERGEVQTKPSWPEGGAPRDDDGSQDKNQDNDRPTPNNSGNAWRPDPETAQRLGRAQQILAQHATEAYKREVTAECTGRGAEATTWCLITKAERLLKEIQRKNLERQLGFDGRGGATPRDPKPSGPPSAQPSVNAPTYEYAYEATYDAIFQPRMEEYDMVKFDPYSFSGAPLGGWGRATRSRLATLPIRLVSDFDGGMELLFGGAGVDGGSEEGSETNEGEAAPPEGDASEPTAAGKAEATPKSTSGGIRPSTGPHFAIHDATGQRYVCRAYDEDELVVLSRLDSVFHPAVTIWDDADLAGGRGLLQGGKGDDATSMVGNAANDDEEGVHVKKHFHFSINNSGAGGNVPEGVRASLSKMLRKMGMADAADALAGQPNLEGVAQQMDQAMENNPETFLGVGDVEVDVDVHVIDVEGGLGDDAAAAVAGQEADELANIIKAAAVGAGMESVTDAKNVKIAPKKPISPPQLSAEEIYQLLTKLDGFCSQLHLGWWSYEWCHQEQVRQFHVAVSQHPVTFGQYEIEDVTLIGQFRREVQIIYPKGVYGGELKKGRTESIVFNSKGVATQTHITAHTPKEDVRYSGTYHPRDHILDNHHRHKQKMAKLGHGGPIVRHTFANGDLCEEAGRYRQMEVELRCCTEEEIDHWLESKKMRAGNKDNQHGAMPGKKKGETPLAVLVGVQEDETCLYRSRVCTPLLCPKPIDGSASSDSGATLSSSTNPGKAQLAEKIREQSKNDPFGALLTAIFGDDLVNDAGEVQVLFPDGETGDAFDELVREANDGGDFMNSPVFERVKEAMRKARGSSKKFDLKEIIGDDDVKNVLNQASSSSVVTNVKDGDSIREILDKTIGQKPCLLKNQGWWTYEFCHRDQIRQYHANNLIDANTGLAKQVIETEHLLGKYEGSGNSINDYPNEDEHLHVINPSDASSELQGMGKPKRKAGASPKSKGATSTGKTPGGNGAVYVQEYAHGDVCDHADVAESVIKGGNVVHGSVERSTTVRFSCGKRWEMIDIKEDSTCHYVVDVTVPELCQHKLFKAPVTKSQVVKCLPV